jgi:hypothetical protein
MAASDYASPGSQTTLTSRVYEHAGNASRIIMKDPRIASMPAHEAAIHKTCKYIFTSIPHIKGYNPEPKNSQEEDANEQLKKSIFRQRDLDQILKDGQYPTCSDIGLLFRGLMIAQGHPTAFVETFRENYLFDRNPQGHIYGHIFGRVFYDGDKSLLVNPQPNPIIAANEADILPYIIFREGLDSKDIGISSYEDMYRLKEENKETLLAHYEKNLKEIFERKMADIHELRANIDQKK